MSNFIVNNSKSLTDFNNRLDTYWIDFCSSSITTDEIFYYYQIEDNLKLIDSQKNNPKALALAMQHSNQEFLELLLLSEKIKHKSYDLLDISHTISKSYVLSDDAFKLLIDCFENHNDIFKPYKPKHKKIFIESCVFHFIKSNFLDEKSTSEENHKYFLSFMKKHKVNPYENKFWMLDSLISLRRINTLDIIIDQAKKLEDKEKILSLNSSDIPEETQSYFELKRQEIDKIKQHNKLKSSLLKNEPIVVAKKNKI
jgi:hypothetical protein